MNFFITLKVWKKLALIAAVLALPLIGMSYLVIADKTAALNFVKKEQTGVEYLGPLQRLLHSVALHRGLTNTALYGKEINRSQLSTTQAEISKQIEAVDGVDEQYGKTLQSSDQWNVIKGDWQSLKGVATSLSPKESFTRHTEIITKLLGLSSHVGNTSNLILDPELDSYYLMDSLVSKIPRLLEDLGTLRAKAASLAEDGGLAQEDYLKEFTQIIALNGKIKQDMAAAVNSMSIAFANNPTLEPALGNQTAEFNSVVTRFLDIVTNQIIDVAEVTMMYDEVFAEGTKSLDSGSELYKQTSPALYDLLQQRRDRYARTLQLTLITTLLAGLLALGLVYWVTRIILKQLGAEPGELRQVADSIAAGNLDRSFNSKGNSNSNSGVFAAMEAMQSQLTEVIEQDIALLVDSVRNGDLEQRINLDGKEGFYKKLSAGINDLVDVNEQVVNDTAKIFDAMARGDLTTTIETDYRGSFDQLKQNANSTLKTLSRVIEHDIQDIVDSARAGDLSQRISLEDKAGFYQVLSSGVNELVDAADRVIVDASQVLGSMASGDLTSKIEADYEGSFGQLKTDINATVDTFTGVVDNISTSASEVLSGAHEIAQGNNDLSRRTEEQAASLEETASSMEEMTSTVRQNADNAHQANQLSQEAREQAKRGGEVVSAAITAMGEITTSSNKIAEIIEVINEIAFQTNLLALNAAVEAARAGEQGRGFAVVASEVRNLAQRSASASKDIKDLIEDSVAKVGEGSELVNKSGETLEEINASVKKVSDIIAEISAAGQEQSAGIEQVNKAITQMDQRTQQNAALVEQAAAASESVGDQAEGLNKLVSFFTTNGLGTRPVEPFVEKRGTDRPWQQESTIAEPPVRSLSPEPANKIAAAGGDDEWEEF